MADRKFKRGMLREHSSACGKSAIVVAAILPLLAAMGSHADGATYYWDPGQLGTNPGSGGTGAWNTTSTFWNLLGSTGDVAFPTGSVADFAATAGTSTLGTAITAGGLIFDTPGYTVATNTFALTIGTSGIVSNITSGTSTVTGTSVSGGSQTWTVAAGGTLEYDAAFASSTAANTFQLNSSGTTNITNTFTVAGKSTLSGVVATGIINLSGTEAFETSSGDYAGISNVTVNNTAGTAAFSPGTSNGFYVGNTGTTAGSTLNISGGSVSVTSATKIYVGDGFNGGTTAGDGTINIGGGSGAGTFTTGVTTGVAFTLGNSVATGTINLLSNGTLATERVFAAGSTGKGIINFNGGTLLATGTALAIPSSVTTSIRNGGAIINDATFAVTLAANFAHSNISGDNAIDGGLTTYGTAGLTLSGILSMTGGATFNAGGTISGVNTYSGVTNVNSFIDSTSSTAFGATGTGNNTVINTGGTIRFRDHTFTSAEPFTINGGSFLTYNSAGTSTFSGAFTLDSNSVIQISPQAQTNTTNVYSGGFAEGGTASNLSFVRTGAAPSASVDVINVTAASTYGGNTFITDALNTNTGSFSVKLSGVNNALPVTTTVTLGGANAGGNAAGNGNLILGDATTGAVTQSVAGIFISGTGTKNSIIGGSTIASTLTVTPSTTDTYAGMIGGTATNANNISLVMGGTGTLSLTGATSYTGSTSVTSGTLAVNAGSSTTLGLKNTSGVSITGGDFALISTLASGSVPNLVNDAATVSLASGGLITLSLNGNSELISGFTVNGFNEPAGMYGFNLPLPAGASADADSFFTSDSNGSFTVATPEPASISLLALAFGGLMGRRRRRCVESF